MKVNCPKTIVRRLITSHFLKYAFFNSITNRKTLVASSILMIGMNGWAGEVERET